MWRNRYIADRCATLHSAEHGSTFNGNLMNYFSVSIAQVPHRVSPYRCTLICTDRSVRVGHIFRIAAPYKTSRLRGESSETPCQRIFLDRYNERASHIPCAGGVQRVYAPLENGGNNRDDHGGNDYERTTTTTRLVVVDLVVSTFSKHELEMAINLSREKQP